MTLFGYELEFSNRARRKFYDVKLFRRPGLKHLVWWKFSLRFGPGCFCEECEVKTELGLSLCDECHSNLYCECGTKLETSGDGLCSRCD